MLEIFKREYNRCKKYFEIAIAVAIVIFFLHITGIGCPIKYLTGISCAGCGMSRAYYSLIMLDIKSAFYYHPLFFTVPFAILVAIFKEKMDPRLVRFLLFTYVCVFVIIYVYRMFWGTDDIVVFEPQNGLIYRSINYLRRYVDVLFEMWS